MCHGWTPPPPPPPQPSHPNCHAMHHLGEQLSTGLSSLQESPAPSPPVVHQEHFSRCTMAAVSPQDIASWRAKNRLWGFSFWHCKNIFTGNVRRDKLFFHFPFFRFCFDGFDVQPVSVRSHLQLCFVWRWLISDAVRAGTFIARLQEWAHLSTRSMSDVPHFLWSF